MPVGPVQVVLLTRFHSITARVELNGSRFSDRLNDERESNLRLSGVAIARLANPARILAHHPGGIIPKHQIVLAFEMEKPSANTSERFYGYVKKNQHKVFLLTDGIEIRGVVHTTDSFEIADIHKFIAMRREMFLPVTRALITFCDDERFVIRQPAVMLNINRIHYIARDSDPVPAPNNPEQEQMPIDQPA